MSENIQENPTLGPGSIVGYPPSSQAIVIESIEELEWALKNESVLYRGALDSSSVITSLHDGSTIVNTNMLEIIKSSFDKFTERLVRIRLPQYKNAKDGQTYELHTQQPANP